MIAVVWSYKNNRQDKDPEKGVRIRIWKKETY
jgi:hypothetical protein